MLFLNKKVTARGAWYQCLPFGDPQKLRDVRKQCYTLLEEAVADIEKSDDGIPKMPLSEAALKASSLVEYLLKGIDEKGETFPRSLVLSNIVLVTAAGFTTTASLLSWLLYSLMTYPGNQERLLQELIDHGINHNTEWTVDVVNKLSFLDKFVKETQRLHNAAFQPARTTKTKAILPGGYRLPPESVIVTAIYGIHTNPRIWRDPTRFDPDRWDSDEVKNRHRAAYIPFATGPRGCIGFNFALLEVKILLSELVFRYEFTRDGYEAIEYDPEFQLIRPLNLYVSAKRRTEWLSPSS
jgi:cytochrome P450